MQLEDRQIFFLGDLTFLTFNRCYCAQVGHYLFKNSLVRRQSDETVAEFIAASAEFNLTIAEQLQLINLCPTTLVEIYLSVDQADVRLGTERAQELLDLILKVLYLPEDQIQESTAAEAPRLKLAPRKPGSHRGRGRGGKDSGRGRKGAQRGGRSQSAKR